MATNRKIEGNLKKSMIARKKPTKSEPKNPTPNSKTRGHSKQIMLIKLLERAGGATIEEMVKMTGWQRHSIRGVISGVLKKRLGRIVSSVKEERGRVYRMVTT